MFKIIKYTICTIFVMIFIAGYSYNNISIFSNIKPIQNIQNIIYLGEDTSVSQTLAISFNVEDVIINDYLLERLKPIRINFKRINSIEHWLSIKNKELMETLEGGEAIYYSNDKLEKIITMEYGETFQIVSEFYFLDNEISFVIEKNCQYNRPMYYDSIAMMDNNDTEIFDLEKSEVLIDRSYFEKGKLIHQICDGDCGAPFSDDYLAEEEIRIKSKVNLLLNLEK